jgi:hypothetical protein
MQNAKHRAVNEEFAHFGSAVSARPTLLPVGAADHVYITDLDGVTTVISHAAKPMLLLGTRHDAFAKPDTGDRNFVIQSSSCRKALLFSRCEFCHCAFFPGFPVRK